MSDMEVDVAEEEDASLVDMIVDPPVSPASSVVPASTSPPTAGVSPPSAATSCATKPRAQKKRKAPPLVYSRGATVAAHASYRKKYNEENMRKILAELQAHRDKNANCWPMDQKDRGGIKPLMKRLAKKCSSNNPLGKPQSEGGIVPYKTLLATWDKYARTKALPPAVLPNHDDGTHEQLPPLSIDTWKAAPMGNVSRFVFLQLHIILAGFIGWRAELKRPCTEEEAGEFASILMTESSTRNVDALGRVGNVTSTGLPSSWKKNGNAPPKHWWNWFYNLPEIRHIVKRKMNSLSEARAQASRPEVVQKWFDEAERDLQPLAFKEHVLAQYPVIAMCIARGITVAAGLALLPATLAIPTVAYILQKAAADILMNQLLHDPARNACFDEKGLILSGTDGLKLLYVKGKRAFARQQEDGTWCSICPLAFFDGHSRTAIIVEGTSTKRIHPDCRANLWGDDTFLEFTKCGYNNTATMLKIIDWWVKLEGARLPFILWMDNASMHCTMDVITRLRTVGIIVRFFRSHSTHWSCMLDNGVFCRWNGHYDGELARLTGEWNMQHGASGPRLPLEETLKAIKFATEQCLAPENITTAVSTTTHSFYTDAAGKQLVKLDRTYATDKMAGNVTAQDQTSRRTKANMVHDVNNNNCMEKFKKWPGIAPFFDNHRSCTRCMHVTCTDLEVRCVDCLHKKERKGQLLWEGGYGASLAEQEEWWLTQTANADAEATQTATIAATADNLRQQMDDDNVDDTDKLQNIIASLSVQAGKVFHEVTCKRGKDGDGNNIQCQCTYGKARAARGALQKKIAAAKKIVAATTRDQDKKEQEAAKTAKEAAKVAANAAKAADIAAKAADKQDAAAAKKGATEKKAAAAAAALEKKTARRAEEETKQSELLGKIMGISGGKKSKSAKEKEIKKLLDTYVVFVKSTV